MPASATGMPAAPMAPAGAGGAGAGPGARSGASGGQAPTAASPGTRPAAADGPADGRRRTPRRTTARTNDRTESSESTAIPVSDARAERDAIADATRRGDADRLTLARRIAAALNAPDNSDPRDMRFFWVTAITIEGAIVVANNYALAYIPEKVQLADQVHMATSDEAIPAAERARWATYPVTAVQGWAGHRNTKLRAVIATEEQFGASDPGAAKIVLQPDDIPKSGAMTGRSRLQVVNPEAANRLAKTPDPRLGSLLPPPPASAGPRVDQRPMRWLEAMRPLGSKAAGREVAHLHAFHTYAAHAHEVLLIEAHAAEPAVKRSAIAEWLYWKHVTELLDAAGAGSKR
jgi:hypothetical protein